MKTSWRISASQTLQAWPAVYSKMKQVPSALKMMKYFKRSGEFPVHLQILQRFENKLANYAKSHTKSNNLQGIGHNQ